MTTKSVNLNKSRETKSKSRPTDYHHSKSRDAIWDKAKPIQGKDPNLYRKDPLGNQIYKPSYGKDTQQGWNADHIKPKSKGGSDRLKNLQAMQTRANKSIGNRTDKKPSRHKQK